jgi:hypothetical protein
MAMIHVSRGATSLGAFPEEQVREGLRGGRFAPTDLGWREGLPNWQPLSQFPEFAADIAAAPAPAPPPQIGPAPPSAPSAAQPTLETPAPRSGLPWERRRDIGFVSGFFETVAIVLTRPIEAFTVMRTEGGFGDPLLFGVIGGSIGAIIWILLSLALHSFGLFATLSARQSPFDSLLGASVGGAFVIIRLVLTPIIIALALFIWAGLVHISLMLLGGANKAFEATFRALSYAYGATSLFVIVPCCGGLIALVWGLVTDCIGVSRSQETDTGRAVMSVLLPLVVCCGGAWVLVILVFGGIGVLMQHANQ